MRIASIAKAFSGAVALHLVAAGSAGPGRHDRPAAPGDAAQRGRRSRCARCSTTPAGCPTTRSPMAFASRRRRILGATSRRCGSSTGCALTGCEFTPGSRYRVLQHRQHRHRSDRPAGHVASHTVACSRAIVFRPAGLTPDDVPDAEDLTPSAVHPRLQVAPGKPPQDVTTFLSPSGAWASGAIVSTPADLGAFVRGRSRRPVLRHAPSDASRCSSCRGSSSPAGPGTNSAGLAIFRYRRAAAPSTVTPATSPATSSGPRPRPTAGDR